MKYGRGARHTPIWVFGMVERKGRCRRFWVVEHRDRGTLVPIIRTHIAPGAHIMSDMWGAYHTLADYGFRHQMINHRYFIYKSSILHSDIIDISL